MSEDTEIAAIRAIANALEGLDWQTRLRILEEMLSGYLADKTSLDDLRGALVDIAWDDELDQAFKDEMARIDLFAIELAEGLRPEADLRGAIMEYLGISVATSSGTPTRYVEVLKEGEG